MIQRISALALALARVASLAADQGATSDGAGEALRCTVHEDIVMLAMCDELERAKRNLRLEDLATPYFLSYRVDETHGAGASGHLGALTSSNSMTRARLLSVEMRVGGPDLDNSNYFPEQFFGSSPLLSHYSLPLDDDYRELRRQMWLATDVAYKHALETLSKKRAALKNKTREAVPDFLAARPHAVQGTPAVEPPQVETLESTVRALGAVFKKLPSVDASRVDARASLLHSRYVNSEGSYYATATARATITAAAKTQAPDGMVLQDAEVFVARTWQELPPLETMARAIRELGASLQARRHAESPELYNGPVLFEGQAAAELFGQAFVGNLVATRVPVTGSSLQGFGASTRNPFVDKIGARVLPRFLNLRDDPTVSENAGGVLHGGYVVDAEGVPAEPTTLVEGGVLRTLLATRNPVAGISKSTGNRRGAFASPSNLIVTAAHGLSRAKLRDEFMTLVRESGLGYGVVVERLANANKLDGTARPPRTAGEPSLDYLTRAFKLYLDGTEEPIRKGELSGFGIGAFKDIVAVSRAVSNHHTLHLPSTRAYTVLLAGASYGATLEEPVVTISVPDLLFEDLTIRPPSADTPRPPALSHPLVASPLAGDEPDRSLSGFSSYKSMP